MSADSDEGLLDAAGAASQPSGSAEGSEPTSAPAEGGQRPALRLALLPSLLVTCLLPLATLAVFVGCLLLGLVDCDAMGALYLLTALLCSFGRGRSLVWLPASLLSTLTLLIRYFFQLRFGGSRIEVSGCDTPSPSAGCDLEWAGFRQYDGTDWQDKSVQLLLDLLPGIALQMLCVAQRQLQLHAHTLAVSLPFAQLAAHLTTTASDGERVRV